jgi:hypothetical protein
LNTRFRYRINKNMSSDSILSQLNPVHALTFCSFTVSINIILQSTLNSRSGLFPLDFPQNTSLSPLPLVCYVHRPFHLPWFDDRKNIVVKRKELSPSSLCNFLNFPIISYVFGLNFLLNSYCNFYLCLIFIILRGRQDKVRTSWLILRSWIWKRHSPQKYRWNSMEIYGITT